MPTFAPGYVPPGFYVQQADISTPSVAPGIRIAAIIGQGAKTLGRQDRLVKGAKNGQDGPLAFNTVISLASVVDDNGVIYKQGRDYKMTRNGSDAYVDWSLAGTASITGSVDISALTPDVPTALDGKHLRLIVNGVAYDVVLTTPADAADVVSQINAWDAGLIGVASINAGNNLILSANNVQATSGDANVILGFDAFVSAGALEPAVGVNYTVSYVSDKLASEYAPKIYTDMNKIVAAFGEKRPQTLVDSGAVVSSGSKSAVVATAETYTADELAGLYFKVTSGTGKGQVRVIIANTVPAAGNMTLTLSNDWTALLAPDATSLYSVTDVNDNSISKGCQVSINCGATVVITSQYQDDIFNDPNIKAAIDALKNDIEGFKPYTLTLMRGLGSNEPDPITYLKAQVELESDVIHNRWRMATFGLAKGNDSFTTISSIARATASDRMFLVNISDITRDFGFGKESLDGSYVAAAYAGIFCTNEDAGEPFTNRSLAAAFSVADFADPFTYDEKNIMAAAGVSIIERNGNDIILRDDLSTDPSTNLKKYGRLLRLKDFVSDFYKTGLTKLTVGQRFITVGSDDLRARTKANFNFLTIALQNPPDKIKVNRVDNLLVDKDPVDPQQLDINADIILVGEVKYVFALLGFGV